MAIAFVRELYHLACEMIAGFNAKAAGLLEEAQADPQAEVRGTAAERAAGIIALVLSGNVGSIGEAA